MNSPRDARSILFSRPLSPIAPLPALVLLQRLLEGLEPLDELLLLTCAQGVPDARSGAVEELPDHGPHAALHVSGEDLLCEVLEAGLQPREFGGGTPAAATLAAALPVAPAFFGALRVVDVAPLRAVYRYTLTGRASLRYAGAFGQ
jgi:hypothetical protein